MFFWFGTTKSGNRLLDIGLGAEGQTLRGHCQYVNSRFASKHRFSGLSPF